jgi:Zn-dependent peptidase ImmA (M78 family)/transcriptional regulator with XRE-family HTH domain
LFLGKRLRQARELRRMTQKDLAKRVGKSQGAIANIEGGFTQPSPNLVASLASHLRFPIVFFSKEKKVDFPLESLMFRARAATTRRDAVAASRYAEIVYEVFEYATDFVNPIPVRLQKSSQTPNSAAQQARRMMGLPPEMPIPHLIHEIEKSGICVLSLPLDLQKVDAFSAWVGSEPPKPVIAICKGKPGDRLRWNVAHELGHLILHGEHKRLQKEHHLQADSFAAELLLPEVALRQEITLPVTLSSLAPLKVKWGVAIQALTRRAYDLKIITKRQYTYLFEQIAAKGWRTREPANLDVPQEKPRALMKMAEVAFGGPASIQRIATETKLSPEMVGTILSGYDTAADVYQQAPQSGKVIPLLRN